MSADNWAICPRCLDEAIVAREASFQAAVAGYGKVSVEEYARLQEEAQKPIDEEAFRTFREDYEFYGAGEGKVIADYSGHCSKCKLGVDFKHVQPFYSPRPRSS